MKLFHREYGEGMPMIIVHGIFGMSDNWIEVAKAFADTFKVYLLDLRNHGHSPHHSVHNYEAMSEDIREFLMDKNIQKACFIGHSMGGKLMMHFANMYPKYIDKLIIVDISPKVYNEEERVNGKGRHQTIIRAMIEINHNRFTDRRELNDFLNGIIEDEFTKQVIQKNIQKNSDQIFNIRMNIDAIVEYYKEIGKEIQLGENIRFLNVLFIFGSESPYFRREDEIEIREKLPFAQIEIVKNAGHIVHFDNKEGFLEITKAFLTS